MVTGPRDAAASSGATPSAASPSAGDRPQPMARPIVVGQVDVRRVRAVIASRTGTRRAVRVVVQADDGARVDPGRAQQLVAVLARRRTSCARAAGRRIPVRTPPAGSARRTRAGSASRRFPGRDRSARRRRSMDGDPCGGSHPSAMRPGRGRRDGSDRRARRRAPRPGRSSRTTLAGCRATSRSRSSGADDVIRRCHDEREVGDGRRIVAKGTERADVGHGTSRRRLGESSAVSGRSHRTIAAAPMPETSVREREEATAEAETDPPSSTASRDPP